MAYQKSSKGRSKKVWISILVVLVIIVAVVVGIMIGRSHSGPTNLNYTKGWDKTVQEGNTTTIQEEATVETTVDEDNPVVQVNMVKANQLANAKYPGYEFELEALRKGADGRFYYQMEGVDSHGNVKNIRVDALSGAISEE